MDRSKLAGQFDEEKAKVSVEMQQVREELNKCKKALEHEQSKVTTLEVEKATLAVNLAKE